LHSEVHERLTSRLVILPIAVIVLFIGIGTAPFAVASFMGGVELVAFVQISQRWHASHCQAEDEHDPLRSCTIKPP
jgi:hypothetical protein